MKSSLWLLSLACLLVTAQAIQLPYIEEPEEEDVLDQIPEDEDMDIARALENLFEDEEIDEDDDDDEEITGRQLVDVTASEQERYNTFMDTVMSQVQRQAKRDLEPLKFTFTKPKKNKKNGKKKQNKKQNNKKNKNKNNNKRTSKDIDLPEFSDVEEDTHQIQKRQAEEEEDVGTDEEINNEKRRNKNLKKINKNKNNNRKNKIKNNKKQKKSNNKVVLHGMSNIKREGDVKRYNMKKGTALKTEFTIGPVELDVTRKIDSEEHKAAATAEKLEGTMILKINKQGTPKIKKLKIGRPKDIKTTGSIARGFGSNVGSFKRSIIEVAPTAAKKLLKLAKGVISNV